MALHRTHPTAESRRHVHERWRCSVLPHHVCPGSDWNIGYVVLHADFQAIPTATDTSIAAMINTIVLASIDEAAREEADVNFSGTYSDAASNSTITISTSKDQLGLGVDVFNFNGTNLFSTFTGGNAAEISARLFPTGLANDLG